MDSILLFAGCTFVFYLWHIFGVTIGLHRLLSHRAFSCPKLVEYFFVFGAYFAFHGSPVWWATIHRAHHRYSDTPLDPHTPTKGAFSAYTFYSQWKYPDYMDPKIQCRDLMKDPIYRFLESGKDWKLGYFINVSSSLVFRVLLWYAFGPVVAAASLFAGLLALNSPLILNIVCHMPQWGYTNFDIEDRSRNNWLMAIICVGDGWHNNHHAVPGSSNMGLKSWEIDPSYLFLRGLRAIGLVSSINETLNESSVQVVPVPVSTAQTSQKRPHHKSKETTGVR